MQNDYNQKNNESRKNLKNKFTTKKIIYTLCGIACFVFIVVIIVVIIIALNNHTINEETTFASNDTQTTIEFTAGNSGTNSLINTHLVYNYDADDNVIGLKTYFKYPSEDAAKAALEIMKDQPEFKGAVIEGNYIVVTAEENQYKGLTASDIRQQAEAIRKYQESIKPQDVTENTDEQSKEIQEESSEDN